MSLRVWLPLTKDLRNQGLDDVTVTNNGATFNSAGKLGGCYQFDGTNDRIQISNLPQPQNISVAMWFKRGANTNSRQFLFTAWNGITLELGTSGTVTCSVATADGQVGYCTTSTPITTSTGWTHICFTFESGVGTKLYINGNFQMATAVAKPISWNTTTGNIGYFSTYFNGSINDFRLYDHCLSPMEVKELAKGLVLHYPLNRGGWGQENLVTDSTSEWSAWITPATNTQNSTNYPNHATLPETGKSAGDVYTCQVEIEFSGVTSGSGGTCFMAAQGSVNSSWSNGTNPWGYRLWTSTVPADGIYKYTWTGILDATSATKTAFSCGYRCDYWGSGKYRVRLAKFEKGSVATPWTPHNSQAIYSTLGLNGTTEYDCSGFCNNGTRTGTFSWTSDTPKHNVSTEVNGNYIALNEILAPDTNVFSWSVWLNRKLRNVSDKILNVKIGSYFFNFGADGSSGTDNQFMVFKLDSNHTWWQNSMFQIPLNEWHHWAGTFDGTYCTLYKDGQQVFRLTTSQTYNVGNVTSAVLSHPSLTNTNAKVSDIRIYATALSADDIKSLYQNSAYIDSSGNVYGAVHSEF